MVAQEDATKTLTIDAESDTLKMEKERAKDQPACLIIIRGKPQGKRFILSRNSMIIGRDAVADLVIDDTNASRKHAEFMVGATDVRVRDNGSTNGTFVNDQKISGEVALKKEDMVRVGNTVLKFLPAGELEIMYIGSLESAAHTDALTKLYNKGYIMEALEAEFKRAKGLQADFSVLISDLDFFKKVNDTYGHDCGDYVLKETATLLKTRLVPKNAIIGRFGGEEYVVLLPGTPIEEAMTIAEAIRNGFEKHKFIYEEKQLIVTTSIGVAEMTADIDSSQALFKLADKAVYISKNAGRNKVSKV